MLVGTWYSFTVQFPRWRMVPGNRAGATLLLRPIIAAVSANDAPIH